MVSIDESRELWEQWREAQSNEMLRSETAWQTIERAFFAGVMMADNPSPASEKINAHFENCLNQLESASHEIGCYVGQGVYIPPLLIKEQEIFRRYVREAFYLYFNQCGRVVFTPDAADL